MDFGVVLLDELECTRCRSYLMLIEQQMRGFYECYVKYGNQG
jgi:hypothetical protein